MWYFLGVIKEKTRIARKRIKEANGYTWKDSKLKHWWKWNKIRREIKYFDYKETVDWKA